VGTLAAEAGADFESILLVAFGADMERILRAALARAQAAGPG
jgi:hypothetical protein